MLDRISFVIGEALTALRRHGFLTFSAITTVAISLYLLGGLGFLYRVVSQQTSSASSKFEMYVYVKQDGSGGPNRIANTATPVRGYVKQDSSSGSNRIADTAAALRGIDGVGTVTLIPRDKAWALEKQNNPAAKGIDDNPLPDSFKVTFSDLSKSDSVVAAVRNITTLDPNHVEVMSQEQHYVSNILRFIGWLSSAGVLLLFIAGTLIFNTVRQAILARSQEIRIMSLVGASRLIIGIPFLIEGLVHGTIGGLVAGLFVWLTYSAIQHQLVQSFNQVIDPFPAVPFLQILTAVGAVYGVVCSLLALRFRHRA